MVIIQRSFGEVYTGVGYHFKEEHPKPINIAFRGGSSRTCVFLFIYREGEDVVKEIHLIYLIENRLISRDKSTGGPWDAVW